LSEMTDGDCRGWKRWWTYQRERFPLLAHGPLIAAFSFCTLGFSVTARGGGGWPEGKAALTAFVVALLLFLQLRVADEHKDYAEDLRYRPYRPVQRGLVSLKELALIGIAAALVQILLTAWLKLPLLLLLLLVWGYLALMTFEFFSRNWLRSHPVIYMLSHMAIMPLIDLLVSACDWLVQGESAPDALAWLLAVSFGNGIVIEIGRKIRAPEAEEEGVETYSALWGLRRAALIWLIALVITGATALGALMQIGYLGLGLPVIALLLAMGIFTAVRFLLQPSTPRARWIETAAGLWTLCLYITLGALPLLWRSMLGG
jgi:hypothetical protein